MKVTTIAAAVLIAAFAAPQLITPRTVQAPDLVGPTFLPENDMKIPVGSFQAKGITQEQFNKVIDEVEALYRPIVAAKGGRLVIERAWEDATVNAYALRRGNEWVIKMFGGLARHEAITQDGMSLVVCHELGHHLGGAPKKGIGNAWASNEGQSDYYANLKCLRRVFGVAAAEEFTRKAVDDEVAARACGQSFNNASDRRQCIRGAAAGFSVSALFQALRREPNAPRFGTPDPAVVSRTNDAHPGTQCRLDTYFQGALCSQAVSAELDDRNPVPGTCTASTGFRSGIRPRCWYKPGTNELINVAEMPVREGPLMRVSPALSTLKTQALWMGL
ncbi:MAG: hypothetical protein HY078_13300 [Elusimicrobia bacterium]|nr:hypothetical protein [Elusimicrobiota bacterium]